MKLDFSQFHPLDHPWWRCRDYPGGLRRHFNYAWHFKNKDKLRSLTLCKLGYHKWTVWYRGADKNGKAKIAGVACHSCPAMPNLAQYKEALVKNRNQYPNGVTAPGFRSNNG